MPTLALVAVILAASVLLSRPVGATSAGTTLPEPELVLTPAPLPFTVTRLPLEPPPPPPSLRTRPVDLGLPPLPPFASAFRKGFPSVADPGGLACGLATIFGRAGDLLRCGVARILEGELDRAREALEGSLAREPSGQHSAEASLWLAELDFRESRYDAAASRYRAALTLGVPTDLRAHAAFALGWIALRRGDPKAAQEVLRDAADRAPPSLRPLARFLDGVARLLDGQTAAAISRWEEGPLDPMPEGLGPELAFWRGVALARRWEPEPAVRTFDQALRAIGPSHPLYVDVLAQRGWVQLMRGMPDQALRDLMAATAVSPQVARTHVAGLVRAYAALGRFADAREAARRLAAADPDGALVVPLLLHAAEEALRRGATEEAVESYLQLRQRALAPELRAYVTYRIAEGFERGAVAAGQPARQRAAQEYQRLHDEGGDEGLAQRATYWLALNALREGQPAVAFRIGEALLTAGTTQELHDRAVLLTAEAAARAGAPDRAARLFRLALAATDSSRELAELHLALGWALFEGGDMGVALVEWQRAAQLGDARVALAACEALAMATLDRGDDLEALDALRRLAQLAPAHPERLLIALNRGVLLERRGDHAAAVEELRPLLAERASPEQEAVARRTLGIALYRLGLYREAQQMFQEAAQRQPGEASNWLGAGLAAYRQGRADDAERSLHRARLSPTPQIAITAAYALVLLRRDDPDELRKRAGTFIAAYPTLPLSATVVSALVRDALAQRHGEYALAWARWLLRVQPESAVVQEVLVQLAQADYAEPMLARDAYQVVVNQVQDRDARLRGRLGLARAAMALGRSGEAEAALAHFIGEAPSTDPRVGWAYGELVRLHLLAGQREPALASIEAFLARFPDDAAVSAMQLKRGEILLGERRWGPAQQAFTAARDAGDTGIAAQAHLRLGEIFRARGDHDAAIEEYLAVIYLYPDTPSAALALQEAAQSYVGLQRSREARIVLQKLVSRPSTDPRLVAWAREALGRLSGVPPPADVRRSRAKTP
jgi:tetratricopeptide (TPR) repeat protein